MSPEDLQINELAQRAGVTVRTIRYYIDEGLLPPPDTKGRYAVYSLDYVDRLKLIQLLKDLFLPLKEIREKVAHLDPKEVQVLLVDLSAQAGEQAAPPGEQLPLEGVPRPPEIRQESLPMAPMLRETTKDEIAFSKAEPDKESLHSAREYLSNIITNQSTVSPRPRGRYGFTPETEDWQRVTLAPGVELHVLQPVQPSLRAKMRQLVEFARNLFGPDRPGEK